MSGFQVSKELLIMGDDLSRPRLIVERERLARTFPGFSFRVERGLVTARGLLSTSYGGKYLTKIESVEKRYPYEMPGVWLPYEKPTQACPHRFVDGSLCVMKPEHWTTLYSFAFMVARVALWLNKYDSWKRTGRWPGKEQAH